MATTQYIGARYVPLFADPIEWSKEKQYEPLTIVLHNGNSFTSKQFVPSGIEIDNTLYWAETGNYNAQIEEYRNEVLGYKEDTNEVKDLFLAAMHSYGIDYRRKSFTDGNGKRTIVFYAIIPNSIKPKLRLANDIVNTVEHEIDCAFRNKSLVLINAGIFAVSGSATRGATIVDGEIVNNDAYTSSNDNHVLYMDENGFLNSIPSDENTTGAYVKERLDPEWCVTAFSNIVENGRYVGGDTYSAYHPRSIIAQDFYGNYLVFSCGGRSRYDAGMCTKGIYEFIQTLDFPVRFAFMLDGGASVGLCGMGIRNVNLVDNDHRLQANFISFEVDNVNETLFDATHPAAIGLIEQMKYYQYLPAVSNAAGFDYSTAVKTFRLNGYNEEYENPYFTDFIMQSSSGSKYAAFRQFNTDTQELQDILKLDVAAKEITAFLNKHVMFREDVVTETSLLSWSYRNTNTNYTLENLIPNGTVRILGLFFVSNAANIAVPFYFYNFGTTSSSVNVSLKAYIPFIDDSTHEMETYLVELTFATTTENNETVMSVSYTAVDHEGTAVNPRLMRLIACPTR